MDVGIPFEPRRSVAVIVSVVVIENGHVIESGGGVRLISGLSDGAGRAAVISGEAVLAAQTAVDRMFPVTEKEAI